MTRARYLGVIYAPLLLLAALFTGPARAQVSWTPGFARCASSFDNSAQNYYEDRSECPIAGHKQWLLGVQSEASLGNSCAGPNGQSLPINAGGPISLSYEPYQGRSAVRLHTDFYNLPHPCGPGPKWTWFSIMDHAWGGGGPLPGANDLSVYIKGTYNEVAAGGLSRMGVTWQGFWAGKSLLVDVMLYLNPGWGDAHPDSDIVYAVSIPTYTYVVVFRKNEHGWLLNNRTSTNIQFDAVIRDLIQRKLLPAPAHGEPWTTASVGPFTETDSRGRVAVDLLLEDFRVF